MTYNRLKYMMVSGLLALAGLVLVTCDSSPSVIRWGDIDGQEICILLCKDGYVLNESLCICTAVTTCVKDEDCNQPEEFCLEGQCVERYPDCPPEENCWDGQVCDFLLGKCVDSAVTDGDPDDDPETDPLADGDTPDLPGDDDWSDPADADDLWPEVPDTGEELPPDDCRVTGCLLDEGKCNPATGRCEWCNPPCDANEECNYHPSGWYCGAPCDPACPDGYACSDSACVLLVCPRCPPCYYCSGSTGYLCVEDPNCTVDGDRDPERTNEPTPQRPVFVNPCMPAATPCMEGISNCCSGACVMGYCL